ncbi:hypothetical protein [Sorangium cellulosum]|uniref:Uncharacterized protein n=1 Tax=Sorangium cellulosum So0157-2 TaxID=1254432 RepID=S4YEU0_SORCE|nr:hypothetical protein [Sorangium cellulosum]AGP41403.1 hypothetical protein SCE1572_47115 [Sorangium cellulosum So0157-2]
MPIGSDVIAKQFGFAGDTRVWTERKARAEPQRKYQVDLSGDRLAISLAKSVHVDEGATIQRVVVRVTARPPGRVRLADVAEVRASSSGAVIDFGRMRTVGGLDLVDSANVAKVAVWQGAAYSAEAATPAPTSAEVMTERLLCTTTSGEVDVAKLSASHVTLPGGPADLELVVAGRRVFFENGEVKRGEVGSELSGEFEETITEPYFVAFLDITEAVLAARPSPGGDIPVEVRAATYGRLSLTIQTTFTRVHQVAFPGGERALTLASEGTATLEVPLPSAASSWTVSAVALTVAARLDGVRTLPATGPALSTEAELVLDADHPIALQLPAAAMSAFGHVAAVRLPLAVKEGGAELAGTLLADVDGSPGEPVPGGACTPVMLAARSTIAWETVPLVRPLVRPAGPLWLALQVGHGTVRLALAASAGGAIRRGRPGGPWRGFSASVTITPTAALRVSGTAPDGQALYALAARLGSGEVSAVVPTADGAPLQVTAAAKPPLPLVIDLTATAAGTYRFTSAQVFYRLPTDTSGEPDE